MYSMTTSTIINCEHKFDPSIKLQGRTEGRSELHLVMNEGLAARQTAFPDADDNDGQ